LKSGNAKLPPAAASEARSTTARSDARIAECARGKQRRRELTTAKKVGFETAKLSVPTRGGIRLGAFATSRREVAVRPGYDGFATGELARGDV
jgi:hypothetical protein